MKPLTDTDISQNHRKEVFVQDYSGKKKIEGIKIVDINRHPGPDGTFEELLRLAGGGVEAFPGFELKQVNRSRILPGGIKAWHLHYNQEDIWYADPEHHLILGLWDVREGSSTKDLTMKIILGAGFSRLIYIPRGVAHGVANLSDETGTVFYFINQQFNLQDPDERRLPWNAAGDDFWEIERG